MHSCHGGCLCDTVNCHGGLIVCNLSGRHVMRSKSAPPSESARAGAI